MTGNRAVDQGYDARTDDAAAKGRNASRGRRSFNVQLDAIGADGRVTAADVLALRAAIFPDGAVDRDELTAVFALGERAPVGDPEWPAFFAEVCADFFLNEEQPAGYVTNGDFAALKAFVTRDGHVASALELGMLVRLLEKAVAVPPEMSDFVADQIRAHVLARRPCSLGKGDADVVRRFLYAAAGGGAIGVTRDEAELVFDLHDASVGADNADEWRDLFVKAIAAHLMQFVGYRPLPRQEALRLHAWASDHSVRPGSFLKRMVSGGAHDIFASYRRERRKRDAEGEDEIGAEIARMVTAREADWLAERIGRNGATDPAEAALIAYLRELGAELPPKLAGLVDDMGHAASG